MGKGRLKPDFLERVEVFSDRCVSVAEKLAEDGRFQRIVDQFAASSTSVGANIAEADEAMSVKDFRKTISIAIKELAESRFWIKLFIRRQWLAPSRLEPLLIELEELKHILGSILTKTTPHKAQPGIRTP